MVSAENPQNAEPLTDAQRLSLRNRASLFLFSAFFFGLITVPPCLLQTYALYRDVTAHGFVARDGAWAALVLLLLCLAWIPFSLVRSALGGFADSKDTLRHIEGRIERRLYPRSAWLTVHPTDNRKDDLKLQVGDPALRTLPLGDGRYRVSYAPRTRTALVLEQL